jgi:ABC-2 type transport system ATP-binding protein
METDVILQTQDLCKYFGRVHAVDGVSINVSPGSVYGFLGPNGSGKTTTIGMILGLLHPTAGSITMFGEPVRPSQTRPLRRVGALVGAPSLVPYLSARRNLELLVRLYPNLPLKRIDEILEIIGLSIFADRQAGQFSSGMKQRLGLGMAMIHQPELLILDEPTNGMDPAGMRDIRDVVKDLSEQGVTIFLSSHLLHEVEQICDRVAVLKQGKIIAEGEVKTLLEKKNTVRVRVSSTKDAAHCLRTLPGAKDIKPNGSYLQISGIQSQEVVAHLTANGIIPSEVLTGGSDLESIFLELTEDRQEEMG